MVLAGAASFGILSSFVKIAYSQGYTPAEISFIQALMGAGALWSFFLVSKKQNAKAKDILWLLFAGASIGITTFLYYLSVKYIPASVAIVLLMQFTWLGILIEWILFKKRPMVLELVITVIILAGTILASGLTGQKEFNLSPKGVGIVLASSLVYAIYIVANSRVGKNVYWQNKSAWIMTGSAAAIFLVNFHTVTFENHIGPHLLKWGLFLAFFGTVLPQILFAVGMPKVGASTSGLLMTVELPVAVVTAHLILKEEVNLVQFFGIVIMLSAIIGMNVIKQRGKAAELVIKGTERDLKTAE